MLNSVNFDCAKLKTPVGAGHTEHGRLHGRRQNRLGHSRFGELNFSRYIFTAQPELELVWLRQPSQLYY